MLLILSQIFLKLVCVETFLIRDMHFICNVMAKMCQKLIQTMRVFSHKMIRSILLKIHFFQSHSEFFGNNIINKTISDKPFSLQNCVFMFTLKACTLERHPPYPCKPPPSVCTLTLSYLPMMTKKV